MSKHTKGPWKLGKENKETRSRCGHNPCKQHPPQITGCELHAGKSSLWIADIHGEHLGIPLDEFRANARLIKEAPNMLKLLKDIRDWVEGGGESFQYSEEIEQVIAKAV